MAHTLEGRAAPQAAAMGAIGSSSGAPEELPIGPSCGVYVWVRSGTDAAQPSQRHGERMGPSTQPLALGPGVAFTIQCVTTLSLPRGLVTIHGLVTFTEEATPFTFAITGGTGAYKTAHGQIRINIVSTDEERYTLSLIL